MTRESVARAWMGLWYLGYVSLKVLLGILIGVERRSWILHITRLHYIKAYYGVKFGGIYGWEPYINKIIKKILKKGLTFIDIGAYKGHYTFQAYKTLRKKANSKIIAIEPFPNNYRSLESKFRNNPNVRLLNKAIWIKDEIEVDFYIGNMYRDGTSATGRISQSEPYTDNFSLDKTKSIRVKTIRLDTLIKSFNLERVDLVKMDVQGAEYEILTDPTLDLFNVCNMIVEVHYKYGSQKSREIISALAGYGFKIVPLYPEPTLKSHHLLACRYMVPQ
jgi:FkbM family methyltransferase